MRRIQVLVFLAAVAAIVCPAQALEIRPASPVPEQHRFNPDDIVRQVRSARRQSTGVECPTLDGEFLVDTNVVLTGLPTPYDQDHPAVAFDGTDYLVVWDDHRNGARIWGTRVGPDGTVLDSSGIAISTAAGGQLHPAVSFDGTNYLVVWELWPSEGYGDICGARVSPAGEVLDPQGIAISTADYPQRYPALACDGDNFLVAWTDLRNGIGCGTYGARVTPAGAVLDPDGIAISASAESPEGHPAVGTNGEQFMVVWEYRGYGDTAFDIHGARVDRDGRVLDSADIAISTADGSQYQPALGFDGDNYLVAWTDTRCTTRLIYAARVRPDGTVLDSSGLAVSDTLCNQCEPAVAFDGSNFLVAWCDDRSGIDSSICLTRVSRAGIVLDTSGIAVNAAGHDWVTPAVAFDGADFLVVWADWYGGRDSLDVCGARVTPAGLVLDPEGFNISTTANYQFDPAVASDGTNYLVVWEDSRNGCDQDIYAALVGPAGALLDLGCFGIARGPEWQSSPTAVFDGENYLVAWEESPDGRADSDLYGSRVSRGGIVLDPDGFVISATAGSQGSPSAACDGTNCLVAWHDSRYSLCYDVYGARVTQAGTVLDPGGIAISAEPAPVIEHQPRVVFDGANYLVVWDRFIPWETDIYGARVTPAGTVLDSNPIVISEAYSFQADPTVAFDGANSLVAWGDGRNSSNGADIYGARVSPAGAVLDPDGIAISAGESHASYPTVVFDGSNYLVVWTDYRPTVLSNVHGARVAPTGAVLDSGPIVNQEGRQIHTALACGQHGNVLLAYEGWAGIVGGRTYNTDRIWGKMNPNPAVAEMAKPEVRMPNSGATIVRGCLFMPASLLPSPYSLLSIDGRKVMELRPGANDVSRLSPGVYFVRTLAPGQRSQVAKVVVARKG